MSGKVTVVLSILLLGGCGVFVPSGESPDARQVPGPFDGGWVLESDAASATGTASGGGTPRTDGEVVDTQPQGDNCTALVVEYPPEWECSAEEIAEAGEASGGYDGGYGGQSGTAQDVSLRTTDCNGLADLRRAAIKAMQRRSLEQARLSILGDKCFPHTEVQYVDAQGRPRGPCWSGGGGGGSDAGCAADGGGGGGAQQYSTTNNQVPDVDEADFIKNTGKHIFMLSGRGLHIVDAWPPAQAHEIAFVTVSGEPRRLFLRNDRLVVYSYVPDTADSGPGVPSSQGCTYGYFCRFTDEGGRTLMTVLDVADPSNPMVVARYEMSGGYVSSRRIDSIVYTVVHDDGVPAMPGVNLWLDAGSPAALEFQYAARLAAADKAVDEARAEYFLPWVRWLGPTGDLRGEVALCTEALASKAAAGASFVSVVALDLDGSGEPHRSLVAIKPGFLYASADALYLATDGVDGTDEFYYVSPDSDFSTIHKFGLDGVRTRYRGSVRVRGHVLNQFSMDEYNGVLRVATSSGQVPDPGVSSTVTTLVEKPDGLHVLGELKGLTPQEDIRAVRFDGDRGFVVTFKKTDPLLVINLSDPASPSLMGELTIPGFSTYMQRLDANHLLAVGFDADDHGDFAFFDGIQIQIFDVTDLLHPTLLHRTLVGTRGTGSEALENHLAFNYFPPKKMLSLPLTICEGGGDGTFGDTLTFSGLMVFDIDLDAGVVEHGRMPFVDPVSAAQQWCGSWWTDARSLVKRSIFMDDYAVGLSDTTMNFAALADLKTIVASVPIAP